MRGMAFRRSLLLSLVASLLASTCVHPTTDGAQPGADTGPLARNATTAALLPTHVAELPTFDTDTYRRLLTELRGTPVVVNVWAAWCGPCKAEAPLLHAASHTYGDRVQFVGVDILDSLGGARGFIADHGFTYPSIFDPSGSIRDSLGMIGQPVTVFYDAKGNVAKTYEGQLTQTALDEGIRASLG